MTDISERLRYTEYYKCTQKDFDEAADEIERLRAELKKQRSYPALQEALKAWGSQ